MADQGHRERHGPGRSSAGILTPNAYVPRFPSITEGRKSHWKLTARLVAQPRSRVLEKVGGLDRVDGAKSTAEGILPSYPLLQTGGTDIRDLLV